MPNGVAYPLPPELKIPSSDALSIEIAIGEATAAAILASFAAVTDYWTDGAMTPETREANGTHIARMYELQQQAPPGFDFAGTARQVGKQLIHARYGAAFRARFGVDVPEVWLDEHIDHLLGILSKVTAAERRPAQ